MRKRAEPRIVNLATHPKRYVSLIVAAEFLALNPRTVRARIEEGSLPAWRDGRVYRIAINDLRQYVERRQIAS